MHGCLILLIRIYRISPVMSHEVNSPAQLHHTEICWLFHQDCNYLLHCGQLLSSPPFMKRWCPLHGDRQRPHPLPRHWDVSPAHAAIECARLSPASSAHLQVPVWGLQHQRAVPGQWAARGKRDGSSAPPRPAMTQSGRGVKPGKPNSTWDGQKGTKLFPHWLETWCGLDLLLIVVMKEVKVMRSSRTWHSMKHFFLI